MTTQIKRRRGTTTQHASFTGAEGELTIDTTKDTVVVHDGSTAGGHPLAKASEAVAKSGDTMTGDLALSGADITFGDNDKAIFGAGSDLLQIYRNSSGSYVKESGSGSLYIQGTDVRIQNASGENILNGTSNGAVTLYYDNAAKIATTSFGAQVTGSLATDTITNATANTDVTINTNFDIILDAGGNVGIGTSSPSDPLHVNGTAKFDNYIHFGGSISTPSTAAAIYRPADNQLAFSTANTEAMRINSSGRVGIGTSSPSSTLDVVGNIEVSGTVDGRDVAADGSKLDGIEAGATADQTAAQILTAIKTVDGSGSGLDADLLDGFDSSQSESSNTVAVRTGGGYLHASYFNGSGTFSTTGATSGMARFTGTNGTDTYGRSYTAAAARTLLNVADGANRVVNNNQLTNGAGYTTYTSNQATDTTSNVTHNRVIGTDYVYSPTMYLGDTLYHIDDANTYLRFETDTITLRTGGSNEITVNTTGVRLGDSGNGYFQPVSGNYGSIQIDGGSHGGWEGYSIGGRVVFMHDNSSTSGIYNDVNNEWMVQCLLNGAVTLYHNGSDKLDTLSNGVSINGNLYTDGSNAEDYDALSGTSPTCNVDNAGAFSLTMTGNTTFTFSGADSGWSMGFILQLTGNGGTVTWPSSVKWAGGTAPDAPASGETDVLVFHTRDGGTNWYGVLSSDAAA